MTTTASITLEHETTLERKQGSAILDNKGKPTHVSVPLWGAALKVAPNGHLVRGHVVTGWRVVEA
jgi:hypothetical protein